MLLIIFGSRSVTTELRQGDFYCPKCNARRKFKLYEAQQHGHLYFLPIVPLGEKQEFVECQKCRATFLPEVLRLKANKKIERYRDLASKAISGFLIQLTAVDESIEDAEVKVVQRLYGEFTGETLSEEEIRSDAEWAGLGRSAALRRLRRLGSTLSVEGRKKVIRAGIRVAAADRKVKDSEVKYVRKAAKAIGLTQDEIEALFSDPRFSKRS